ncbi:MAG: hypothetical protein JSS75_02870 [Bacteroidetes bacterium]|nr:hypothetical protein [Bacteroidota bacterium]
MSRSWIVSIAVLSSLVLLLIADPIISCGPDEDPYDYYTSFFQRRMESQLGMKPFYYTSCRFLYDERDELPADRATSAEWAAYLGKPVTDSEAYAYVCGYSDSAITSVYLYMTGTSHDVLPDSITMNPAAGRILSTGNIAAAKYLAFTRDVQPYVTNQMWSYEPVAHDSMTMLSLALKAEKAYTKEKDNFLRTRYAYQALRLCYYAGSYKRTSATYAKYFASREPAGLIDMLALSIKAGVLYHSGQKAEAAYLYSKEFDANPTAKISNYLSFGWCIDTAIAEQTYYQFCKNTREAANMAALFALHNPGNAFDDIKRVAGLDPSTPALEVLAIREVHKLEEGYLSPRLARARGAVQLFVSFNNSDDVTMRNAEAEAVDLIGFFERLAAAPHASNPALFELSAAYIALMVGRSDQADRLLNVTATMQLTPAEHDQLQLTRLLLEINRQNRLDADFERALLPSLQWLESKARISDEWSQFYRNIFTSILAPRYLAEGKPQKMVLCIGRAEHRPFPPAIDSDYRWYPTQAIEILRHSLTSSELETLQSFLTQTDHTEFERYLIAANAIEASDVFDCIGTSYLRTFNWSKAAEWFRHITPSYFRKDVFRIYLGANCFADPIEDTHAATAQDTVTYTKLSFAERMIALEALTQNPAISNAMKASAYYSMACGMYQMSYYGNSWMLMEYAWTSNEPPALDSLAAHEWRRNYYGAFRAEEYFNKALALTVDRNMQAKCLFMAAKCNQKQLLFGSGQFYGTLAGVNNPKEQEQMRAFLFNAKYFPRLAESYSNTEFFQQALNTCSYLNDFYTKTDRK